MYGKLPVSWLNKLSYTRRYGLHSILTLRTCNDIFKANLKSSGVKASPVADHSGRQTYETNHSILTPTHAPL